MPAEIEKPYLLENGLPGDQVTPVQIEWFKQEYGRYPAKLAVNPKHRVTWEDYFIPAPMNLTTSIEPLPMEDIPGQIMQGYLVPIEYDEKVDEHTLVCIGLQPLIDFVNW
jgi:hypothetical protein